MFNCVLISFKLFVFVAFILFWITLKSSYIPWCKRQVHTVQKAERKSAKITLFLQRKIYLWRLYGLRARSHAQPCPNEGPSKQSQGAWRHLAAHPSGYLPLCDSAALRLQWKQRYRPWFRPRSPFLRLKSRHSGIKLIDLTAQKVWQSHSTVPEKSRGAWPKSFYVWFIVIFLLLLYCLFFMSLCPFSVFLNVFLFPYLTRHVVCVALSLCKTHYL